jgi:serine/threonine-protein kinase HipA
LIPVVAPLAQSRDIEGDWAKRFDAKLTKRSARLLDQLVAVMEQASATRSERYRG